MKGQLYNPDFMILHPEVYSELIGLCTATLKDGIEYGVTYKEYLLLIKLDMKTDKMTVEEFEKVLLAIRI
jgi:hypothetical protein